MVIYLLWENLDPSVVINRVYFLVLDQIAITPNTNHPGAHVNQTPVSWRTQVWSLGTGASSKNIFHINEKNQTNGSSGPSRTKSPCLNAPLKSLKQ